VSRVTLGALALLLLAGPSRASELSLEFHDGRVTLIARDVSLRQILDEWARVGQAQIVNADRVSATPLTLELDGLPEGRALEILLRSAAGYMAAPRGESNPGPSLYDRILVLAVSSPPAASRRADTPARFATPRRGRLPNVQAPPAPLLLPDEDSEPIEDELDEEPVPQTQPGRPVFGPGAPMTPSTPAAPAPFYRSPGTPPASTTPGSTSVPGIVAPPPEPDPDR